MRKTFWIGALVLAGMVAQAATNDLTTALQKGLFEEEANRNLDAAIQAYQSVAKQFDKDRKLAATAIFRLGECYRKQGNTNGAVAQFERIVREFSDQSALATLSRQNLAGLGMTAATGPGSEPADLKNKASELTNSEAEEVKRIQALIKDSPDLINASDQSGLTPLHKAAQFGQLVVAQFLLANGADTEAKDQSGRTPLHAAAQAGHKAMVELLLSKKATVGATDKSGETPLHLAAENGYRSVAEALLAHGAPVDATNKNNSTPLLLAASHGLKSVIELLLTHGANINAATEGISRKLGSTFQGTALCIAAKRGDQALAELLITKGAAVDAVNKQGRTALSYAAENQDELLVRRLLGAHANPNAGSSDLPLASAAYHGNVNLLKLLVAAGADINASAKFTSGSYPGSSQASPISPPSGPPVSALFLAVYQRHPEAVRELVAAKADLSRPGPNGQNPIIFQALPDSPTLEVLLAGGADPNQRSLEGYTPLQAVAGYNNPTQPESVKVLLAHGADPNLARANGLTPLHTATDIDATNIMALLLQNGADVNAKTVEGYTALRVAVERGNLDAAKLLLENKADPNLRDNRGTTALDYAKSHESTPGLPGRPSRSFPSTLTTSTATAATPLSMADLLRQYGALDDLPRLDAIELRRPSSHYSETLFTRDTNAPNQFTLAELVGVEYALLAGSPAGDPDAKSSYHQLRMNGFRFNTLPYPDLAHVRIRTPAPDLKSWRDRTVSLMPLLEAGICTNVVLNWGDLVEIPEEDHAINDTWHGFTPTQLENLTKCLKRQVEIVIKGQATPVTLGPEPPTREGASLEEIKKANLWLRPALLDSKLVLASSDLSRVKLIRRDKATGKKREWVIDCSGATPAPQFWLQDGDVIEVPEKAQYGAAETQGNR